MTKLLNNTVETLKGGTRITITYRNTLQEIQAVRAGQQPKEILRPVRRLTEQGNCQTPGHLDQHRHHPPPQHCQKAPDSQSCRANHLCHRQQPDRYQCRKTVMFF